MSFLLWFIYGEKVSLSLEKLLKVRRAEQPLLMLMVGTICLFQFCQIINENFSETVFLKR